MSPWLYTRGPCSQSWAREVLSGKVPTPRPSATLPAPFTLGSTWSSGVRGSLLLFASPPRRHRHFVSRGRPKFAARPQASTCLQSNECCTSFRGAGRGLSCSPGPRMVVRCLQQSAWSSLFFVVATGEFCFVFLWRPSTKASMLSLRTSWVHPLRSASHLLCWTSKGGDSVEHGGICTILDVSDEVAPQLRDWGRTDLASVFPFLFHQPDALAMGEELLALTWLGFEGQHFMLPASTLPYLALLRRPSHWPRPLLVLRYLQCRGPCVKLLLAALAFRSGDFFLQVLKAAHKRQYPSVPCPSTLNDFVGQLSMCQCLKRFWGIFSAKPAKPSGVWPTP